MMPPTLNLWLWLVPYVVLLLVMVYAMMEFAASLLVKRPPNHRLPVPAVELRARILALEAKASPDDQVTGSANALEFRWQESTVSDERFVKAKQSSAYRIHVLLDEGRHELWICESSSSYVYFVGLYHWLPRVSAFAGYSAGASGMTPNIQQIMSATLAAGWTFRPVILPFQTTERGAQFLHRLTPTPLRRRSSTLLWGILYPFSYCLAFIWLFAFGGAKMHSLHNFLVLLLISAIWWGIWGFIAWGVCGFRPFWRRNRDR